jgi:hypothetical protein
MTLHALYYPNLRFAFFICFNFTPFFSNAQPRFIDNLSIAANYHYGFVVPEYSNFLYLVDAPVYSSALSVTKKTSGKNDWEIIYNYPEYGFSLFYSTLGNDDVHGREIAVYPFFKLNIISGKRFNFYNQTGLGFGYVTRKFDLKKNYLNVAVGSHVNFHFNLQFGTSYQLAKKIQANAGISFDHLSNANSKEPNLGINYITGYAGLSYLLGNWIERQANEVTQHQPKHHFEFIYSAGGKHPSGPDPKTYFTSSATFEFKWQPFRVLRLGIGADLFYDTSTKTEILALYEPQLDYRKSYDYRSGLHISQEFVYNKLSLILQEGIYVLLKDEVNQRVMYNRGIVRYQVGEHVFIQLAMKSHLHVLDYPEFGLGWKW